MSSTARSRRRPKISQLNDEMNEKGVKGDRRATTSATKVCLPKRQLACSLHRQADQLHQKGDYEGALVLYHRAAQLHPQNTSHTLAAKKISALILSSSTIPKKPLVPSNSCIIKLSKSRCSSLLSLKTTIQPAADDENQLNSSLRRKNPSKAPSQLETVGYHLKSLKTAFSCSNFERSIEIGNYLLTIIPEDLPDQYQHQVAIERYVSLAHLSLNRHDRALEHAIKMIASAEKTGNIKLRIRSFVVLGKVHLTVGHLTAAAKGWECLLKSVEEAVPRAWLLHEIGRCYYEMGNDLKALELSRRCCDWADEGHSNKWLCYGKLLAALALIRLGRLGEALESLRRASTIAQLDNLPNMYDYIGNLMKMVSDVLRRKLSKISEKQCLTEIYSADLAAGKDNETFTTTACTLNDEFNGKLFTSRTQVIRAEDENSCEINTSGTAEEINGSKDCYIIEKWKKHLSDIKSSNNAQKLGEITAPEADDIAPLKEDQPGNLPAQEDVADDNSEDTARTYDIQHNLLYQYFEGESRDSHY